MHILYLQTQSRFLFRQAWRMVMGACALGLSLIFSGCVRYHDKPLNAAANADAFASRTLSDARLKEFISTNLHCSLAVWPLPSWDCTNLVMAALYYHPELDAARAKWLTAQAAQRTAGERPNPSLSIAPAYNATTGVPSPWLVTPALDAPIETAGKRGYRMKQAAQLAEAARYSLESAAWQVRSRVRRALVDLYVAQESAALLQAQQTMQTENVRLLEGQYRAGVLSNFELTQARLAADGARLAWRDAQRQCAEARAVLANAIGIPLSALEQATLSFVGLDQLPAAIPANEARHRALLTRADILGALHEYAAAQAALQLEIAKQYPDVNLSPGYEYDQGDNKWSLGLAVTLPVFSRNQGAIAEAMAKREEAAANFNALQAKVLFDIDRNLTAYKMTLQKQTDTEALLANMQKQEQSAQAMLSAGAISIAELIGLQLQTSAYSLARLEALAKAQQALGELEDVLQSSFDVPSAAWQFSPRATTAIKAKR